MSVLLLAASARADLLHYDFSAQTGALTHSVTYTSNGISVTAYAFQNGGGSLDLFGHHGGGQQGVGIAGSAGTSSHEITPSTFVQIDLGNVFSKTNVNDRISINLSGRDSGEKYNIYGSNTLGSLGTLIGTGNNPNFKLPPGFSYQYVSLQAQTGVVLFSDVFIHETPKVQTAPEPPTIVLMALGGVGLMLVAGRRRLVHMLRPA
jgi:hypothetical protein